ncbi:CopD family protein [Salinisphaera sp. T31B1]|uniref:CopD family protein n=1 Tax=Salinisphaera sp. T31B1 TaxID=727963 RepID=UPI0033410715
MLVWLKVFHITFMVIWLAGLVSLPRLFVYHAGAKDRPRSDQSSVLLAGTIERNLSRLMSVGAGVTIIAGVWMLVLLGGSWIAHNGWFHAKLVLVLLLLGFHGWCQLQNKKFRENRNHGTRGYFQAMSAMPIVLLFLILSLVEIKPF